MPADVASSYHLGSCPHRCICCATWHANPPVRFSCPLWAAAGFFAQAAARLAGGLSPRPLLPPPQACLLPCSHPCSGPVPCRSRLKSRAALTTAALALAVVYSLAIFNAGKQAAQQTEAGDALL